MKKIIALSAGIIFSLNVFSQAPNWLWAKSAGGAGGEDGSSTAVDATGNVVVTGSFSSSTITFGSTTLTNADSTTSDIFIVKYSPSGNVMWAKRAGSLNDDYGISIATDASGNVLVMGNYNSPSITFSSSTITNAGGLDIFVVKYDAGGNVLWATGAGGTDYEYPMGIAADASGNVLVTGEFMSPSITFGSTTLTNANAGVYDIFIAKYDASGSALWANRAGGIYNENGTGIHADASGNVLITGWFQISSLTFGSTTLTNAGGLDMFVVKYDPSGNVLWAKSAGGTDWDYGNGITTDALGNVLVTGRFSSASVIFGSDTLTNVNTDGSSDFFVAKYDASGNVLWAKGAGGTNYDVGSAIATDASGNVLVTGRFISASITFGSTTLTNAGFYDVFVVKYDASGNVLWAIAAGGMDSEVGNGIAADAFGNVVVAGRLDSPSIAFGSTILFSGGGSDMFVAKLGDIPTLIVGTSNVEGIFLSPNPATNELTIDNGELKIESVEVFDVLGQRCLTPALSEGEGVRVDVSSLPPGIYFVKLRNENQQRVAKFVKQ